MELKSNSVVCAYVLGLGETVEYMQMTGRAMRFQGLIDKRGHDLTVIATMCSFRHCAWDSKVLPTFSLFNLQHFMFCCAACRFIKLVAPPPKNISFLAMDRPVSMVAVVAALRYDQGEGPGTYQDQAMIWVSAEKLFLSKRRFCRRTTFENFQELLKSDPTRIVAQEFQGILWARAV